MVSASVEFITTRRAVKAAAVEIDAQQLIAHLQSRFGGQVGDVQKDADWERVAGSSGHNLQPWAALQFAASTTRLGTQESPLDALHNPCQQKRRGLSTGGA